MRNIVGIDIGATNLRIALATTEGKILKQYNEKTEGQNLVDQIKDKLDTFPEFEGIGVAVGSPIDINKGIILNPPNMEVRNLSIVEILKEGWGKPCYLLNDCVAAVLGEKMFGVGKRVDNLVYITLSTGIGCGVIVDNRVILGKDGNAHEVGHVVIDAKGKLKCGCGSYGHWEAYSGGRNIPNFVKHELTLNGYKDQETSLRETEVTNAETLFRLAKSDKVASEIVDEIGRINAIGVANIINSYDPEMITIGGSIALNENRIIRSILKHVGEYTINRMPEILTTPLGDKIGIYGAIAGFLYFDEELVIR